MQAGSGSLKNRSPNNTYGHIFTSYQQTSTSSLVERRAWRKKIHIHAQVFNNVVLAANACLLRTCRMVFGRTWNIWRPGCPNPDPLLVHLVQAG
jgi:hypothetical protein